MFSVLSGEELERLSSNAPLYSRSDIAIIIVECDDIASRVISRTNEILKIVIGSELTPDDTVEDWSDELPFWSVDACSRDLTIEESKEMMRTPEGVQQLSQIWTIDGFIYWFRPEQRSWFWWDAVLIDTNIFQVHL